ncbi:MAG: hypothetical protein LBM66_00980 [Bifidobacteriaceae bacterium]|jgi:glutathione synthase/RimK-type ligase-like ATP-grasp enzyme|nr:hypothetical protein [Bifidobacteriaceae bacterium]
MKAPRVALVTCQQIPDLDPDDQTLVPALRGLGFDVTVAAWDDPSVDWDRFDLSVIRSAWDYAPRREEFCAWARGVPRLANPADVVEWNTDKHYLQELEAAGVPVVETMWLEPTDPLGSHRLHSRFPALGDFVIKPAISAGSLDAGRYTANNAWERGLALQHTRRLLDAGRTVMLQKYVTSVDSKGEASLVFLSGRFAYGAHRAAQLSGPDPQVAGGPVLMPPRGSAEGVVAQAGGFVPFRHQAMAPHEATPEELNTARAALKAVGDLVPGLAKAENALLYARVDLVAGEDGPEVMELELTEPALYMGQARGGAEIVARAIAARVAAAHRL